MMTRAIPFWLCLLVPLSLASCGQDAAPADLYQARGFVTGQDERFRQSGFAQGLPDVLVKVSGDPRLRDDPRVAALTATAETFVGSYSYRDQMEGIPIGDEQGTRDRPYDLTISFKPDKINAALRSLGREPWVAARPRLVVFLAVRNHAQDYPLASDGEFGSDQRDALAAAAWQMGMPLRLPAHAEFGAGPLPLDASPMARMQSLAGAATAAGRDAALAGTLVWDNGFIGWHANWQLVTKDKIYGWAIQDVSFDEAFRNAMRGAAQALSGHGQPG